MKKILSLLLSLLLLALPVFSSAEPALPAVPAVPAIPAGTFARQYTAQGHMKTTTVTLLPGDLLASMLPEDVKAGILDLFTALSLQVKRQHTEGLMQTGLSLQLSGEDAVSITAAADQSGFFAASSLLGGSIYMLTQEDLKSLLAQASQAMVAEGNLTQQQLDAAKSFLRAFLADPEGTSASLIGQVDLTGVLTAVGQVMSSVTFDVVTEAPQKLPDASVVIHVPLKKADLTVLMESIAKVLWSMPVVQQMAPSVTLSSGAPLTEETLTAALKDIPNVLAEDAMLRIYANQNMDRIYLTFEAVIESETPASLSADMLVTVQESGLTASWSMNALQNQAGMLMSGEATLTANHLDYTVSADMQQGEQTWRAVDNVLSADFTLEETSRTVNVNMNARGKSAPAADVVGLIVTGRMQDQDLGDHAESSAEFTFTLENMGDLFTLRLQETTGMAEAYICNPDIAIRPATMSPEEQTALVDTLRANLQQAVVTSMQKLPASTLRLIMNQFMQNAQ